MVTRKMASTRMTPFVLYSWAARQKIAIVIIVAFRSLQFLTFSLPRRLYAGPATIQLKILQTLPTLTVSPPCTIDCLRTCVRQLHFPATLPPTFSCTLS